METVARESQSHIALLGWHYPDIVLQQKHKLYVYKTQVTTSSPTVECKHVIYGGKDFTTINSPEISSVSKNQRTPESRRLHENIVPHS